MQWREESGWNDGVPDAEADAEISSSSVACGDGWHGGGEEVLIAVDGWVGVDAV